MDVFEIVIALLLGGVVLAALARRIAMPYPALVEGSGSGLGTTVQARLKYSFEA